MAKMKPKKKLITSADAKGKHKASHGLKNTLTLNKITTNTIEIEDFLFHHNSAVFLPSNPAGPSSAQGNPDKKQQAKSGFEVIRMIYAYAHNYPSQYLIIAGHTDTTGDVKYNFGLSELRSKAVLSILLGDRSLWVKTVTQKHKVEDFQQILKHYHNIHGWDCDPGEVNNDNNEKTKRAVKEFQSMMGLHVDGIVGPKTWGAIFDVYMEDLAGVMGLKTPEGLAIWRSDLRFAERKQSMFSMAENRVLSCGECIPKDSPGLDGLKSQTNRRVEAIFFEPPASKDWSIVCPKATTTKHTIDQCPMYSPAWVDIKYINPDIRPENIRLVRVDDHFAPGNEPLDIFYEIKGLSTAPVKLEITSPHYDHNPIFAQLLPYEKKVDGFHLFEWWGNATCTEGKLKDRFISPLYAPYTVTLSGGSQKAEKQFKVLYAKIELERGTWLAYGSVPEEKDETEWLRYQLNELGYFGGPSTSDAALQTDYLSRAIKLYKRRNTEFVKRYIEDTLKKEATIDWQSYWIFNGTNDTANEYDNLLKKEIKAKNGKIAYITGDTARVFSDKIKKAEIHIPSMCYDFWNDFIAKGESRYIFDKKILNEPFLPIKAKIFLKTKTDKAVDLPEVVGEVNVGWRVEDPAEPDMATRYQYIVSHTSPNHPDPPVPPPAPAGNEDTQRHKYIQDVQTWVASKKYTDGTAFKKNCPKDCGGKDDLTKIFVSYKPFTLNIPNKVPCTQASTDWKAPVFLGRTGVNFIPSYIAGDSYRIVADLDFTGLPNKMDLEKWHKANANGRDACRAETGIFTIWRDDRIARIVSWPGVPMDEYQLWRVSHNYEQCYINMTVALTAVDITSVISNSDYQKCIKDFQPKNLALLPPAYAAEQARIQDDATPGRKFLFWKKFNLTKDCLYGRDLPDQKNIPGDLYEAAIWSLLYDDNGFVSKVSDRVARAVSLSLRKEIPYGHIIVAFKPHKPITIKKNGAAGYPDPKTNYMAGYCSTGCADAVVIYDLASIDRRGYIISHECGHHCFLYHNFPSTNENPNHHDKSDWNCIMTYSRQAEINSGIHGLRGTLNPLFCGKCNLRLRGWKIVHPTIPGLPEKS
jgi:hypothetical protein